MFVETNLHLCVLTPDPISEGTNQQTVYHSISCCKLQLSKSITVFCIWQTYFIEPIPIGDFICRKCFWKWPVWILRFYCSIVHRNQHNFWWCHQQNMPLSTWLLDILWTLSDICGHKLTIVRVIWAQNEHVSEIESCIILSTLDKFECWNQTV